MHFSKKESSGEDNSVKIQAQEDNRSLLKQLASKEKIYLSDQVVSDVRVDERLLEELRYSFEEVSKIRTPASYTSVYEGYSDDGLKFSTDLNVIRIYTVNKEAYYKIPVASKEEFKNILNKSIYTSFDFIKQYVVNIASSAGRPISNFKFNFFINSCLNILFHTPEFIIKNESL